MWGRHKLTLETGRMARQADGAVLATYGETIVLATVAATVIAIFTAQIAMGYDNVCWGSDYPHLEGTYGHTQKTLHELFDDVMHINARSMLAYCREVVPAMAALTAKPCAVSTSHISRIIAASPPNKCAQPVMSSNRPCGESSATSGVKRSHQSAMSFSALASAAASASRRTAGRSRPAP